MLIRNIRFIREPSSPRLVFQVATGLLLLVAALMPGDVRARQDGLMPLTFSDDDWAVFVRGTPLP